MWFGEEEQASTAAGVACLSECIESWELVIHDTASETDLVEVSCAVESVISRVKIEAVRVLRLKDYTIEEATGVGNELQAKHFKVIGLNTTSHK